MYWHFIFTRQNNFNISQFNTLIFTIRYVVYFGAVNHTKASALMILSIFRWCVTNTFNFVLGFSYEGVCFSAFVIFVDVSVFDLRVTAFYCHPCWSQMFVFEGLILLTVNRQRCKNNQQQNYRGLMGLNALMYCLSCSPDHDLIFGAL